MLYLRARSIAGSYKIPGGSVDRFSSPGFDVERANFAGLLGPEEADILRPLPGARDAPFKIRCSARAGTVSVALSGGSRCF